MVKRNTLQKGIILDAVRALKNHPSADEVYDLVIEDFPTISRATVFRNLNSLAEDGEIAKREIPNGPDRFDHNCSNHYHLRCTKCGGVFDVDIEYLDGLNKKADSKGGHRIFGHDLVFSGLCFSCNNS